MPQLRFVTLALAVALPAGVALLVSTPRADASQAAALRAGQPAADSTLTSAEWLSRLPDGEAKRRFVLDCTGCHQFDARIATPGGSPRTREAWETAITRMLGFAGAQSGFPVISSHRDAKQTAEWLAASLTASAGASSNGSAGAGSSAPAARTGRAEVKEYMMPMPGDLPHDVQVLGDGRAVITGMFTHRMYVLDPASGKLDEVAIPVQGANPRAVEIGADGDWWVVLGGPRKLARYSPASKEWKTFDVGMYAHSVALAPDGSAWVNGHFTKAPELLARVDGASGVVKNVELPAHPTLASDPGGPIPYEIRAAPDGTIWMSELQGNRIIGHDPRTGRSVTHTLPTTFAGPRRFDIDAAGALWIPAYSANALLKLDPKTGRFTEHRLPVRDAVPYVARVHPTTGRIWLGTSAADAAFELDPKTGTFTSYALPSRGAVVRHMAFDARTGAVWLAYGASPGIPARVARLEVAR